MITNIQTNNQPSFRANVSEGFIKAAHNYYNGVEYRPWRAGAFDKKVRDVENNFGYDDFTIKYKKIDKNGQRTHVLLAVRDNLEVPLTEKDQFRKVIEKFMRMTKGELYIKIKQYRHDHHQI